MAVYQKDDGTIYGWCFSCNSYIANPTEEQEDEGQYINTNYFESIASLPCRGDPDRQLSEQAMAYFGVKTELSTADGFTVVAHYYPYTRENKVVAYKKRGKPKDFSTVGDWKDIELFGQAQARATGSKKLFIVEGEADAVALYQILKERGKGTQWAHLEPAVVSISTGASAAIKDVSRNMGFIKSFPDVVLCLDQDEPGQKAVAEILKLIPEASVAKFDEKDANDMLIKGKASILAKAVLFNTSKYKPASVVSVAEVFDRAISKPTMGLDWPWPTLTKSTFGIHTKKLYGLGSGVGMGKTEWAKELQAHLIKKHNQKIGVFMLEEDVGRTLKGIAGKMDGQVYHKPDESFDEEKLKATVKSLEGNILLFDHFGCKDWQDIKSSIRYMVVAEGVRFIFLDPLTALVSHLPSGEANDSLNEIMGSLAGMTHELDFSVFFFSHLNTPINGPPHERGGKVHESQFTGSRAMMKWSHYLFGLEGDKNPDNSELKQNTRTLVCLKDREFGNVIQFHLIYDKSTSEFREPKFGGY